MNPFLAEIIGTAILIILGGGVVANVILNKTKGQNSGWIVITMGWGMAVFTAVFIVGQFSGAHINPAVTLGLAVAGLFDWGMVPGYFGAQFLGAFIGAILVYLTYRDHFAATEDPGINLAVFSTIPEIRNYTSNTITEIIGTFVLIFGVLYLASPGFISMEGELLESIVLNGQEIGFGLGALSALPVGLLVLAIGLSLAVPPGMRSIRRGIWALELPMPFCLFPIKGTTTGRTHGYPLSAPVWELYLQPCSIC